MNMLVLDCDFASEHAVQAYDSEQNLIPLEAVFFGEPRVRVWVVNLRGSNGKHRSLDPVEVPSLFAHLMLAGVRAMAANPKANNKDHTN